MTSELTDCRFNYNYDNPFEGSAKTKNLESLKEYMLKNINDFKAVNWIEDSRCFNIPFGSNIKATLIENPKICKNVCLLILRINSRLNTKLNQGLIDYCTETKKTLGDVEDDTEDEDVNENETNGDENDTNDSNDQTNELRSDELQFTPISIDNLDMAASDTIDITTYSVMPGKTMTYEQLCQLCENKARTLFTTTLVKDKNVLFAETREMSRLTSELRKYMGNSEISSKLNVNIEDLSLNELQQTLDQAKDIYETIKVTDMIKKGIDLVELACTYVFPNGIKIPRKNKVIKLNGVGESFNTLLFDRNSPLKIAFSNVVDKYNIHVSDGFLCTLSILQTLATKIQVEDIPDPKKKIKDKSEEDEDEETVEESDDNDDSGDDEETVEDESNESDEETEDDD
jgi:hypothetical protein